MKRTIYPAIILKTVLFLAVAITPRANAESLSYENLLLDNAALLPCEQEVKHGILNKYLSSNSEYSEASKIRYLLTQIKKTDGSFIRNGKTYSGREAARFLRWKMKHRQYKKSPIKTAEDFVNRVAVRSVKTGIPYQIKFPDGQKEKAITIMRNELALLESQIVAQSPVEKMATGLGPDQELPKITSALTSPAKAAEIPL